MRAMIVPVAVLSFLATQATDAAPLKSKDVAAGAKWVMHVDFDAMRESKIGGTMREKCLAGEEAQEKIKKFQEDTGVDITKDLHGLTLYDTKFVKDSGVAIFRASHLDQKKIVAKFKEKHPDAKSEKHGDVTISTWTEKKGEHERQVSGALFGRETILFADDAKKVAAAVDVLTGKAESLSAESPLAEETAKGTFVVTRGVGMNKEKTPFPSQVMRRSKQFSLAIGERGSEMFAQGMLVAPSGDSAAKVREVIEGFQALGQLRFGEDSKEGSLLRGLTVAVAGGTVVTEWRGSGDDVAALMVRQHEKMRRWHDAHDKKKSDEKKS